MHDKLNFPIVISKGDVMFRQNSGNGCSSTPSVLSDMSIISLYWCIFHLLGQNHQDF